MQILDEIKTRNFARKRSLGTTSTIILPRLPTSQHTGENRTLTEDASPIQRPGVYKGESLWESYLAQFEIIAELNKWSEEQKATRLATISKGPKLNILGNLPPDRRQDYKALVAALESHYGPVHRTELSRVHFKHRVKQRDETRT